MTALEKAQAYANPENRRWLKGGKVDSYQTSYNRAQWYVLQGSPPRGFIIVIGDRAIRLDSDGKRLRIFYGRDEELAE